MPINPLTRLQAQQRGDEIHVFARELARLEHDGVLSLTDEQRQGVREHHNQILARLSQRFDIDRDSRSKQLSLGMRIASFLGALALAASLFFLFRQYWGLLSSTFQVITLIAASCVTFAITLAVRRKDASGYFTKLAALVAFAAFVLNIAILGQIFNITPSDKALLPWAAYALLLAYLCDLRLLLAAALVCFAAFIAARAGEFAGLYWLDFGERPENFFPASLVMLAFPSLVAQTRHDGFAATYRIFGLLALFLPMLVLSHWGAASYLTFETSAIEHVYQVLGFLTAAAIIALGIQNDWSETINTGVVFFVIFLYTKFYDWWWELMPKYLFFLVLGLTALLALFILRRLRPAPTVAVAEGRS